MQRAEQFLSDDVVIKPRRYIIRIDRSINPTGPEHLPDYLSPHHLLHPELQSTGPAWYDVAKLEQWVHSEQRWNLSHMMGERVYEYVERNSMLESCLGYADGLAIRKKGVAVFQKIFKNNTCYFLRSAAMAMSLNGKDSYLVAPALLLHSQYPNEVRLGWCKLHWVSLTPDKVMLRFPSRKHAH